MQQLAKAKAVRAPWITLPRFSPYGPIIVLETLPLLLLATVLRIVSYSIGWPAIILMPLEGVAITLAFLVAAWRMIEATDRKTILGQLSFKKHLALGAYIFFRVFLFSLAVSLGTFVVSPNEYAGFVLLGIDGITFFQTESVLPIWNSIIAAIIFMMMLNNERLGTCSIARALKTLAANFLWTGPAVVTLAVCLISVSYIQSLARYFVYLFGQTTEPQYIRNFVLVFYMFGFAVARLWLCIAILTFALRKSKERERLRENRFLAPEK